MIGSLIMPSQSTKEILEFASHGYYMYILDIKFLDAVLRLLDLTPAEVGSINLKNKLAYII